ncbi:MAG: F0F1 ATP synthase subunit A [Ruminococcus sp.]|nr:F0F1 ATP synthase subunit A [Ruminococcus sp.]
MVLSSTGLLRAGYFAGSISEEIKEQINCEVVFRIPVPFVEGGIPVYESTVVTWIIMAVVTVICALLTRNLKIVPNRKQMILETAVGWVQNFCRNNMGEGGMRYFPYLGTVLIYIGISNIIGLFGLKPPTKDLSVTIALALMSIILIEGACLRKRKLKGFFKSLASPTPIMLPMNILEIGIRPLSLCMRLFGNVVAAFIIMELLKYVLPVGLPVPFSLYFDIFDGFLQAYIFVFLTSLFIHEAIEDEE